MTDVRSKLQLFIAFALFPLCSRLLLIFSGAEKQLDSLTTGFLADIYWSFLLTIISIVLLRRRLWAVLPLILLWAVTYAVDIEHITALGGMAHHSNIQYLFDPQFIANSMGAMSPVKTLATAGLLGLAVWLLMASNKPLRSQRVSFSTSFLSNILVLSLVVGGGGVLYSITPAKTLGTLSWHDRNFFAHHLDALAAEVVASVNPSVYAAVSVRDGSRRHPLFASDLDAPRPAIGAARNVLLIVLEGLSGAYLEPVAREMGTLVRPLRSTGTGPMPQLSKLAEQSLIIPNFISHRRQTIRGLYSLLCSDFPKLDNSTPKPFEILSNGNAADRCLPRLLQEQGYSTHYFQAANLQFMNKNTVTPFIGFEDVRGKESFDLPPDYYFDWGPDDSDFLSQSANWLDTIEQQEKPWFATLMTVGTHHPYGLREGAGGDNAKLAAVAAADQALGALVTRLQESGIADNTLILITSDESHGIPGQHLSHNWGLMLALAPDIAAAKSDDVFSTADVTLSVMDYLNLQGSLENLTGRSVFRDYSSERTMLFSQWASVSMSTQKGQIISCPLLALSFLQWLLGDGHCEQLQSANGEMFAKAYQRSTLLEPPLELYQLQAMMDARLQPQGGSAKQSVSMGDNSRIALHGDGMQDLSAGQQMNLERDSLVTLEFDISYSATEQSVMELSLESSHLKGSKTGTSLLPPMQLPSISHGERMTMSVAFPVFSDYSHVQFNLRARSLLSDGVVTVHQYRINTEKKDRFDSLSLELVEGKITATNRPVRKIYGLRQNPTSPLTLYTKDSVYALGSTLRLNNGNSFLKYGGAGWWGEESWGRWSKQNAEVHFFLADNDAVTEQELLLSARAHAYVLKGRQQVEVWGNGVLLVTWDMGLKPQLYQAPVPASLLEQGFLSIKFVLRDLIRSPQQNTGSSEDSRKLGMGLFDFTLSSRSIP
jgi:hypothetical protein